MEPIMNTEKCNGKMVTVLMDLGKKIEWKDLVFLSITMVSH